MKSQILVSMPAIVALASAIGCTAAVGQDDLGATGNAATACPAKSATDDQQRAAATIAFNIMRDAAKAGGTMPSSNLLPSSVSALAPQRYRVLSGGTGIEFDPTDPLYSQVTNAMKADLAIGQLDTTVAKFLSDGLKYDYATNNGQAYPSIHAIQALANYKYPGPVTMNITDYTSNTNSHSVTVTGSAWCGTQLVSMNETVQNSWQYSPMFSEAITQWRGTPPAAFKGTNTLPTTPFNGSSASGNPYLVVSTNGTTTNWANYNFWAVSCYGYANATCTGSIQIDPVPYAEPGAYYNTVGLVGTQANPFDLASTMLYAVPDHSAQWATRTVNSVQEWGTFSTSLTLLGTSVYKYAKQM